VAGSAERRNSLCFIAWLWPEGLGAAMCF